MSSNSSTSTRRGAPTDLLLPLPSAGHFRVNARVSEAGYGMNYFSRFKRALDRACAQLAADMPHNASRPHADVGPEHTLGKLPAWFDGIHRNDKYKGVRARKIGGVVIIKTEDHSRVYGEFDVGSPFMLDMSVVSLFNTFAITVRENHYRAKDGQKPMKAAAPLMAPKTRLFPRERNPDTYRPNHVEDDLHFDFDAAVSYKVKIENRLPESLRSKLGKLDVGDGPYGILTFTTKENSPPARLYGQEHTFSHNSQQQAFFDHI